MTSSILRDATAGRAIIQPWTVDLQGVTTLRAGDTVQLHAADGAVSVPVAHLMPVR